MNDDDHQESFYRDMYSNESLRNVLWFALWVLGVVAGMGVIIKCLANG